MNASSDRGEPSRRASPAELPPCPPAPCCVSSLSSRRRQFVEPLSFSGPAAAARQRLLAALRALPRTRIVAVNTHRVRAECRSRVFGFVDELDFRIDETAGVIHVRSACRFGFWDLGVNRRRIARLRRAFAADDLR